ncbi:Crp/Fnr family transcriptional regulator [Thaumasiovibrio subtropicus]|uniref:Crp/Fnr family transcriptional regulator n=1 Tax=Thaumasiovibrio subtropicus TaxID=1891207 RepID=UPI000B35C51E|nr:Crp/Fnr family transcriptional regulator [Thaumasiovibrio subtropicus]
MSSNKAEVSLLVEEFNLSIDLAKDILSRSIVKKVKKGNFARFSGRIPEHIIFVLKGELAMEAPFHEGVDYHYAVFSSGSIINDGASINNSFKTESILCTTSGVLAILPVDHFYTLLDSSIEFNRVILKSLAKKSQIAGLSFHFRIEKDHKKKVLGMLRAATSFNGKNSIKMSIKNLASMCYISRNAMPKVLKELEQEGHIKVENKVVHLLKE